MKLTIRRCISHSDEFDLRGFEVVMALGPFGLLMFLGRRQ